VTGGGEITSNEILCRGNWEVGVVLPVLPHLSSAFALFGKYSVPEREKASATEPVVFSRRDKC